MEATQPKRKRKRKKPTVPRQRHDNFAKDLVRTLLSTRGEVETQVLIASAAHYTDLRFAPSPDPDPLDPRAERLTQMTTGVCLFEVLRQTPALVDLQQCIGRHFLYSHAPPGEPHHVGHLWILSPGRPDSGLAALGACEHTDQVGFYGLVHGLHTTVVVISELPKHTDTLALRLLGRGPVQRDAIEELIAAAEGPIQEDPLWQLIERWRIFYEQQPPEALPPDELEFLMHAGMTWEELRQQWREEGRDEGRDEGRNEGLEKGLTALAHLYQRRLGRPLTDAERDALRERLLTLGPDEVGDAVLDKDADELEVWLRGDDAS